MKKWITFQLSEKGEIALEEEPNLLESMIKKNFKGDFFLPLFYDKTNTYDNKIFLFRGYIFLEYLGDQDESCRKLANTHYFVGPLLTNRKIHLLPDDQIKKFKRQLTRMIRPKIKVGDTVKILDGKYKNLEANVMEYYKKEKVADLSVKLKCMNILVPKIPIVYLKNLTQEKKGKNSLQEKILELLKENTQGLCRKEIIQKIDLDEKEKKRLSTCLSRSVKRNLIKSILNEEKRLVFTLK